ncbi:hypothetical protein L228DRAFT_271120 [Xylona heveae TC161]|uniref:Stress response protein NST1 n=1 Tax=Xylona heveae (strain CBS 132557 / TC161) TaxID=1328760 RepID=A0A165A0Z2_XYLHT|nr:hypothetical protein L228DRAFT_271120 [Xylona heveae TC161]KZF19801.1 hypothetical protein L228DRAFT_271120 [Xylona heveae TC161]
MTNPRTTGAEASGNIAASTRDSATVSVNRKKQKRRQKQAARLAAEQTLSNGDALKASFVEVGRVPSSQTSRQQHPASQIQPLQSELDDGGSQGDEDLEATHAEDIDDSDDDEPIYHDAAGVNGGGFQTSHMLASAGKRSKKKKKNKRRSHSAAAPGSATSISTPSGSQAHFPPPPPPLPLAASALRSAHKDRIWNTSTQEERERIKDFWLSLGEDERRSLVKVEKEAVLRKMKEQQKHSCSCTVCGRKRTAIEEELEVLYDAYYEELEQYANHQQTRIEDGGPMMPPPRRYGHPIGRLPPDRLPPLVHPPHSSHGRIRELGDEEDDEEAEEDEYSDEDDEEYSDEEPEEEPRGPAADFFNFGNSLTVQGGILTVADDLLKNDGKKFIEMMEQLAERRMQREEEAQYAASALSHSSIGMQHSHAGHNHGPLPEEDEYDDEDEEEYDSQEEEEDYDDDEMDTMTEEQRMEEGRRMFQIFAARMFEQRVLTAYREKVARERQQKLLEELEEESRLDVQREAKKAREAQKKKDKKRQQKLAKEEERTRKEAEKAAEEAAAKALEEKRLEEQRQKKEEQRKKREAERKSQEEEKQRREAEKQRRLREERERQVEAERKAREQKEREKKKREEAKKERAEREAKEKEARAKKDQEERERKEREAKAKAEQEARERLRREEEEHARQSAHAISSAPPQQAQKRASQPGNIPLPPGLHHPHQPAGLQSPHPQVATPVVPKASTPVRPRQMSQQGSHASSPKSTQGNAVPTPGTPSSNPVLQHQTGLGPIGPPGKATTQPPPLQHSQPSSPMPVLGAPPGIHPQQAPGFPNISPLGLAGFPASQAPLMPGLSRGPLGHDVPLYPHQPSPIGPQYRPYMPPTGAGIPPGVNGMMRMPQGRGPMDAAHGLPHQLSNIIGGSNASPGYGMARDAMPTHSHSRGPSASFDRSSFENPHPALTGLPIGRPAPIQRPSSVAPNQRGEEDKPIKSDIDDLSSALGSSALLDDSDEPFPAEPADNRRGSAAPPAPPRAASLNFGSSPLFAEPGKLGGFGFGSQMGARPQWGWGAPTSSFGTTDLPGAGLSSSLPGSGWSNPSAFGLMGAQHRSSNSRPVTIRLMTCQACKQLTANTKGGDGFHDVQDVLEQVNRSRPGHEPPILMKDMLDICETEGDLQNGGGSFILKDEGPGEAGSGARPRVRYEADTDLPFGARQRRSIAPGEIGSPIPGNSIPAFGASSRAF